MAVMCLPRLHNDGKCKKFLNHVYFFAFFPPYNSIIFRIFPDFFLFTVKVALSSCRTVSNPTFCFLTSRRRCLKQSNFVVLILFVTHYTLEVFLRLFQKLVSYVSTGVKT